LLLSGASQSAQRDTPLSVRNRYRRSLPHLPLNRLRESRGGAPLPDEL
jgi:hypothetical protein